MATKVRVQTLIASDLHLGSELFRAKAFRKMLDHFEFDRFIVDGDIFDHLNFEPTVRLRHKVEGRPVNEKKHRLKKSHLEALKHLSGLAKPENLCEAVWVEGNHDEGISQILSCLVGMTVYQEYSWEHGGERYLVIHGDQFDVFYREHHHLAEITTWLYQVIQGLGSWTYPFCKVLKMGTKKYTRAIDLVAEHAVAYAKKKGVQHIICGHTHCAEHRVIDGIHYYNCGSWTETPCHCITIDEMSIKLHEFSEDGEHLGEIEWYKIPTDFVLPPSVAIGALD